MKIHDKARFFYNLFRPGSPAYIIFFVTARCNQCCRMCFYWRNLNRQPEAELTLDEIKKISGNLQPITQLSLTGGEPFLRDDLEEICAVFIGNNQVRYVTIPTNASMPGRIGNSVRRLIGAFPDTCFRICLSIDGLGQEHDEIRGVKGAFEKLIETYQVLSPLRSYHDNLIIDVNTTFSAHNESCVMDVVEFVRKNMDVDNHAVTFTRGNPRDKESSMVSISRYEELVTFLMHGRRRVEARPFSSVLRSVTEYSWETLLRTLKEERMILPCVAGRKLVEINERGDVFPCEILPRSMGNLRDYEYDLGKVLRSPKAVETLAYIRRSKCFCTFECAISNVIFNPRTYPAVLTRAVRLRFSTDRA